MIKLIRWIIAQTRVEPCLNFYFIMISYWLVSLIVSMADYLSIFLFDVIQIDFLQSIRNLIKIVIISYRLL